MRRRSCGRRWQEEDQFKGLKQWHADEQWQEVAGGGAV